MTAQPKRTVNPIPDGFHSVTPYITVPGLAKTIEFLKQAFGAEVKEIMERPGGVIGHAEVKIGDSPIMMGEPDPNGPYAPRPCNLYLYVPDVDAVYARAIAAGGKSLREPTDEFYGDRGAGYIGTARAYPEGGYETEPRSSFVTPEVEEVLMGAMRRLLEAK